MAQLDMSGHSALRVCVVPSWFESLNIPMLWIYLCKVWIVSTVAITALISTINNETLEDWVIMHTYADTSNTVSCPFRILRSMGKYEYPQMISHKTHLYVQKVPLTSWWQSRFITIILNTYHIIVVPSMSCLSRTPSFGNISKWCSKLINDIS